MEADYFFKIITMNKGHFIALAVVSASIFLTSCSSGTNTQEAKESPKIAFTGETLATPSTTSGSTAIKVSQYKPSVTAEGVVFSNKKAEGFVKANDIRFESMKINGTTILYPAKTELEKFKKFKYGNGLEQFIEAQVQGKKLDRVMLDGKTTAILNDDGISVKQLIVVDGQDMSAATSTGVAIQQPKYKNISCDDKESCGDIMNVLLAQ